MRDMKMRNSSRILPHANDEVVVSLRNVSKSFCKTLRRSMAYAIADLAKNFVAIKRNSIHLRKDEFWALDDINLELRRGETLGVIGANGSGKTTLLRLLTGIFPPDKGEIMIKGRVGALIAIGAGFHPHMTGRENIYLNATILGMSRKEIDSKFQDIVDFADIGDFLDAPVATYSSGMRVRLGFSIAVAIKPDVLLVDEVLAVGDLDFHNKCMQRMGEISKKGTTIVLVSHDIPSVQRICQKCLFLNNGKLICHSHTNEVVNEYYKWVSISTDRHKKIEVPKDDSGIKLLKFVVCDINGRQKKLFETGEKILFKCSFSVDNPVSNPIFHISLDGDTYHGYNTRDDDVQINTLDSNTEIALEVDFFGLSSGIYHICIAVWDNNYLYPYYWNWDVRELEIRSAKTPMGRFIFKHAWNIEHKR